MIAALLIAAIVVLVVIHFHLISKIGREFDSLLQEIKATTYSETEYLKARVAALVSAAKADIVAEFRGNNANTLKTSGVTQAVALSGPGVEPKSLAAVELKTSVAGTAHSA